MRSTKDRRDDINIDEFEEPAIRNRRKKRSKGVGVLVVVLLVLLAVAVGVAAGVILGGSQRGSKPAVNVAQSRTESTAEPTSAPAQEEKKEEAPAASDKSASSAIPAPGAGANDFIDVIAEARKNGMQRRAYLTFDDGPSAKVTPQILDTLKENGIKATFFECGHAIDKNPEVTKRVAREGHLIANHSFSHDYNALYATESSFKSEVERTESLIEEVTGAPVGFKLFRFPGGSYNAGDHAAEKQVYKNTLADMGYYYCDWNTLNGDAEGAPKDAAGLVEFFKTSAEQFVTQDKNVIVLMHDSDAKQGTADALKRIIDYLLGYGYTFHRLDEVTL